MKLQDLLEKHGLKKLKFNLGIVQTEWNVNNAEKKAAWDMYIELLTRITTQPLSDTTGDEQSALNSVHSLFETTRNILKDNGPNCIEFSKIAIVVLNQIIRPFTAKWHTVSEHQNFQKTAVKIEFRQSLKELQIDLQRYSGILAEIAGVEDLTRLEKE